MKTSGLWASEFSLETRLPDEFFLRPLTQNIMCGIVGYVGSRQAEEILIDGLRRLEYRGYDSAGAATVSDGGLYVSKAVGKVAMLSDQLSAEALPGHVGIAHTRWATHGRPTTENAHPHQDCSGRLAVVHNGIIENYAVLRSRLQALGHVFRSETDTEIIAHLIEEYAKKSDFEEAFFAALNDLVGTYGIACVNLGTPESLYVARKGSPLVVGLGERRDEFFVASDTAAVVNYTRDVVYLDDGEVARVSRGGLETWNLARARRDKPVERIDWSIDEIERGQHPHFMIKEIFEQPAVAENALRGRLDLEGGRAVLGGLKDQADRLRQVDRVRIVACGSAYLAGKIGEYMLEELAGVRATAELASEFRYRGPVLSAEKEAVIVVSQSGETADTLAALREAKERGVLTIGVVNVVGSTIARETDAGIFTHAGPEIAVASTKAFLAQVMVFGLLALYLGRQRDMTVSDGKRLAESLAGVPDLIGEALKSSDKMREIATRYADFPSMMFVGRKYNAPLASEGALKLKEVAYIHAEGYAAGEMKHGPIAMLCERFPVVALATKDSVYEKTKSAIEEIRARSAPVIAVATEGDAEMLRLADDVVFVPACQEVVSPMVNAAVLQLLAYHTAVAKGLDPDKPRNLAKSVTVE